MKQSICSITGGTILALALAAAGLLLTPVCINLLGGTFFGKHPSYNMDQGLATAFFFFGFLSAPLGAVYGGAIGVFLIVADCRWPGRRRWVYAAAG